MTVKAWLFQHDKIPAEMFFERKIVYFQAEIIQELFETIRNYKSEEGKLLCESFIRVPKRR